MAHTHRAIIIGGGIAGPALSLFLKGGGIVPQIFEAYPEPSTIGGAFQRTTRCARGCFARSAAGIHRSRH